MRHGRALLLSALAIILGSPKAKATNKPPDVVYPSTHDDQSLDQLLNQKTEPQQPAPAPIQKGPPYLRPGGDVVVGRKKSQSSSKPTTYRVYIWQETGDTLWRIAEKVYGDKDKWPLIYQANRDIIKDPNKIYPKQVLKIPPIDWHP